MEWARCGGREPKNHISDSDRERGRQKGFASHEFYCGFAQSLSDCLLRSYWGNNHSVPSPGRESLPPSVPGAPSGGQEPSYY